MKLRNRRQHSLNISNPRWMAYATAGAASALFGASTAEAEIHYSGVLNIYFDKHTGGPREHRQLELDNGAAIFFGRSTHGFSFETDIFGLRAARSNQVRGGSLLSISRLQSGEPVSNGPFYNLAFNEALMVYSYHNGNFKHAGEAFIGFKFNTGEGTQYGWARVNMAGGKKCQFIVVDYAWGDVGDSITTGQTSSTNLPTAPVPHFGSLGALALGAAGLVAWRKSKGQKSV